MKSLQLARYTEIFNPKKLANLKSYMSVPKEWPKNCSAVAMDMGGTNFRIGRVCFDENGNADISDFQKIPMPGFNEEIQSEEFFEFFEKKKEEYNADIVGLCFSYPAEILDNGTARIITFSKEIKIKGAENKILNAKVINDTVAAQLGTKNANMGLILGTGLNICYNCGNMIINAEAGRCTDFPTEDFDFGNLAEMQVSGAYLRPLIAKAEKSHAATRDEIYERAAKIVAAEISGIAKYAGIDEINIAAEGSVFYNVTELREMIISNLNKLGCNYKILDGRDKTLIGAAIAALTHKE